MVRGGGGGGARAWGRGGGVTLIFYTRMCVRGVQKPVDFDAFSKTGYESKVGIPHGDEIMRTRWAS